jgi:hypothetical protein
VYVRTLRVHDEKESQHEETCTENVGYASDGEDSETVSLKLIVRKSDGGVLPGKWVDIRSTCYDDFANSVQEHISQILDEKINKKRYKLAYKLSSGNAASCTALSDAKDFQRFLVDHDKNVHARKETTVTVTIDKESKKKN